MGTSIISWTKSEISKVYTYRPAKKGGESDEGRKEKERSRVMRRHEINSKMDPSSRNNDKKE